MQPVTVDFETAPIRRRPAYPPEPVGVAIKMPGRRARYYAWGHPAENNCTLEQGRAALLEVWEGPRPLLFHNAKFDVAVAEKLGLPVPAWHRIHDTQFLLFLDDPRRRELNLKACAKELLSWEPEERDLVAAWLVQNQPLKCKGVRITLKNFGAYISLAPGDLVGRYAIGDVERTYALFRLLHASILERKMGGAYDRERRLLRVLLDIEPQGIHVNHALLREHVELYGRTQERLEAWLRRRLGAPRSANLDSAAVLLRHLESSGRCDVSRLSRTPKGGRSTSQEALVEAVTDKALLTGLIYRARLATCMSTFMRPWLEMADASGGRIFTSWNQTRGERGGARTGRLSSSPNFQNIPKKFKPLELVTPFLKGLPPLPLMRQYIVPRPGYVLLGRDYSQQELRILAHYADGDLLARYQQDPTIDFHDLARDLIHNMTGMSYPRDIVKRMGFGLLYGMGLGLLAQTLALPVDEARKLKRAYLAVFPGIATLYAEMKVIARENDEVETWGGRLYRCEAPLQREGRRTLEFDYKLVNVLIQGSAADCTKEAVVRYYDNKPATSKLLLTVHDEILIEAPGGEAPQAMAVLKEQMESVEFDVAMLSDGSWSAENWARMKPTRPATDLTEGVVPLGQPPIPLV